MPRVDRVRRSCNRIWFRTSIRSANCELCCRNGTCPVAVANMNLPCPCPAPAKVLSQPERLEDTCGEARTGCICQLVGIQRGSKCETANSCARWGTAETRLGCKYLRRGCIIRRIRNGINFGYSKHAVSKRDDTRIFRGNNRQVNYLHGTVDTQYSEIDNKQAAISE